jgi:hypothetical protein
VLGFRLPLQADSTIVASLSPELSLAGTLRLRVEEIAATNEDATRQAAALATLVDLARGFTEPLRESAANKGLKELLKSAEVSQTRNRVIVRANMPVAMLAGLAASNDSGGAMEAEPATNASK